MAENQSAAPADSEILKQLGEGRYGSVYLIQHPTWGKIVLKKFPTSSSSDKDLERMKKEADIHKNLHHPNILKMFDAQFDSKVCGLFLEYMEYGPVDEFTQQNEVTWEWKLQILHDIALAMSYLHHHQPIIIHGDLKCQNILIGCGYHAKISDFGMAHTKNIFHIHKRSSWMRNFAIHSSRIFERSAQEKVWTVRCVWICNISLGDIQWETPILWLLGFKVC